MTLRHQRALDRAVISRRWAHDPAQYRFHRFTPPEQAHIPFDDHLRRRRRTVIAEAVLGVLMLFGLLALLCFAPLLVDMWWGAPQ